MQVVDVVRARFKLGEAAGRPPRRLLEQQMALGFGKRSEALDRMALLLEEFSDQSVLELCRRTRAGRNVWLGCHGGPFLLRVYAIVAAPRLPGKLDSRCSKLQKKRFGARFKF